MKLRDILLINIAIAAFLFGGGYLLLQVTHWQDQRRSDALHYDAREAYKRAAALRDADASQFDPSYSEAVAAIDARENFDDHNAIGLMYRRTADADDINLKNCLLFLVGHRKANSQGMKLSHEKEIEQCTTEGTPGPPFDITLSRP